MILLASKHDHELDKIIYIYERTDVDMIYQIKS